MKGSLFTCRLQGAFASCGDRGMFSKRRVSNFNHFRHLSESPLYKLVETSTPTNKPPLGILLSLSRDIIEGFCVKRC